MQNEPITWKEVPFEYLKDGNDAGNHERIMKFPDEFGRKMVLKIFVSKNKQYPRFVLSIKSNCSGDGFFLNCIRKESKTAYWESDEPIPMQLLPIIQTMIDEFVNIEKEV
jgi:hypothetical protein